MDEQRRYEVYTRQKGNYWTAAQITRHRKKINQERKRRCERLGRTHHLKRLPDGRKTGYTNKELGNSPR